MTGSAFLAHLSPISNHRAFREEVSTVLMQDLVASDVELRLAATRMLTYLPLPSVKEVLAGCEPLIMQSLQHQVRVLSFLLRSILSSVFCFAFTDLLSLFNCLLMYV